MELAEETWMPPRGEGIWTSLSQQQFLCFPRVNRQPKKRKPRGKTRKRATWRVEENRKNLHQVCPAPNLMIATTSNVNRASTDQATAPNPSRRSNGPGVDGGPPHQATPWTWSCRHAAHSISIRPGQSQPEIKIALSTS